MVALQRQQWQQNSSIEKIWTLCMVVVHNFFHHPMKCTENFVASLHATATAALSMRNQALVFWVFPVFVVTTATAALSTKESGLGILGVPSFCGHHCYSCTEHKGIRPWYFQCSQFLWSPLPQLHWAWEIRPCYFGCFQFLWSSLLQLHWARRNQAMVFSVFSVSVVTTATSAAPLTQTCSFRQGVHQHRNTKSLYQYVIETGVAYTHEGGTFKTKAPVSKSTSTIS